MKIAPTKSMASKLNKKLDGKYGVKVAQIELNRDQFAYYVDMFLYDHEEDWNMNTSKFKVLVATFEEDYGSPDMYFTSKDLRKVVKCLKDNGEELTEENFINKMARVIIY